MNKQVITIDKAGVMSGLQRKPGQGLDLRQFGKADIKRASLIEWSEKHQAWFIDVLQDAGRGLLTADRFHVATDGSRTKCATHDHLSTVCPSGWREDETGLLLFSEYDEAVKIEIEYLDALRLAGRF